MRLVISASATAHSVNRTSSGSDGIMSSTSSSLCPNALGGTSVSPVGSGVEVAVAVGDVVSRAPSADPVGELRKRLDPRKLPSGRF